MRSNFLRLSAALIIVALVALASTAGMEVQAGRLAQATGTAAGGAAATPQDEGAFPPCPEFVEPPTPAATMAAGGTAAAGGGAATMVATTAAGAAATAAPMTVGAFQTLSGVCTLDANLAGANERPNPGPANGRGTAVVVINRPETGPGTICVLMEAYNIQLPATAAHIHRGTADVAGPVVIPLQPPDQFGRSRACTTGVDRALIKELLTMPYNFYVNVHTSDFPAGAIRGQLHAPGT